MVEKELIIPELNNETIESMIYIIRDQKVMLDFELAKIYGYSTKAFNVYFGVSRPLISAIVGQPSRQL